MMLCLVNCGSKANTGLTANDFVLRSEFCKGWIVIKPHIEKIKHEDGTIEFLSYDTQNTIRQIYDVNAWRKRKCTAQ